jgi:NADPH:quinone reductase-like Zn-dependent oxidoreductase
MGIEMQSETQPAVQASQRPNQMNAMVYDDYGAVDVLHAATRPLPKRDADEVLIEVHASSVNPIDYRLRSGEMKGLLPGGFPRIPGYDVAGVVVESEMDSPFRVGDRVMAFLDSVRGGACADYAVCGIGSVAKLPTQMTMEVAAAIPLAGTTALQSLRDHGKMKPGDRVLINGASGGVGMFAVQIAKANDCHVDAVASGDNREYCMSLGADHFYDYEKTDFSSSEERWDIVFDASGKSSYWESRPVMNEGGRYVSTEPDVKGMLMKVITWPLSKSGTVMLAKPTAADLRELIRLYELGKLKVTIDSRFPMRDVAKAHDRVKHGVDRGKVVLFNDAIIDATAT